MNDVEGNEITLLLMVLMPSNDYFSIGWDLGDWKIPPEKARARGLLHLKESVYDIYLQFMISRCRLTEPNVTISSYKQK